MQEIKDLSVGRIVHYFPGEGDRADDHVKANGADVLPAIVVQCWGNMLGNLQVFCFDEKQNNVNRYSVHHKSIAAPGLPYWDWPEIK